jgi:hypothetical protein
LAPYYFGIDGAIYETPEPVSHTKVVNIQIPTKVGRNFSSGSLSSGQQNKKTIKIKTMKTKEVYTLIPSIGGSFSFGWGKMFDKFVYLLVIIIISGILQGPFQSTFKADSFHFWMIPVITFGLIWGFLFVPVIKFGEKYLFLKAMREEEFEIRDLFDGFTDMYVNIILSNLIVFALVGLGFVMLIIPGIILLCRLAFVPYIVMDQKLEPMQAIEKSWQMTRGHGWEIFFMGILSFFLIIGGIICLIAGVFVSIMWIHSAFASLYQSVLNQDINNNILPILGVNEVPE